MSSPSSGYVDLVHAEGELEAYIAQKKLEIDTELAEILTRRATPRSPADLSSDSSVRNESADIAPKHPRWYIEEDNVVFMVEGQLFRVPRYAFQRGSARFRQLVKEQTTDRELGRLGSLRWLPIKLPSEIMSIDFERFLDVLYPLVAGSYPFQTADEWTSILRVAHHLDFNSHKALAISQLYATASPIDKIVCSHEFGVTEWLEEAYLDICARTAPLTLAEGARVGLRTFAEIAAAREAMRGPAPLRPREECVAIVREVFWPVAVEPSSELADVTPPHIESTVTTAGPASTISEEGSAFVEVTPATEEHSPPEATCEPCSPVIRTDAALPSAEVREVCCASIFYARAGRRANEPEAHFTAPVMETTESASTIVPLAGGDDHDYTAKPADEPKEPESKEPSIKDVDSRPQTPSGGVKLSKKQRAILKKKQEAEAAKLKEEEEAKLKEEEAKAAEESARNKEEEEKRKEEERQKEEAKKGKEADNEGWAVAKPKKMTLKEEREWQRKQRELELQKRELEREEAARLARQQQQQPASPVSPGGMGRGQRGARKDSPWGPESPRTPTGGARPAASSPLGSWWNKATMISSQVINGDETDNSEYYDDAR